MSGSLTGHHEIVSSVGLTVGRRRSFHEAERKPNGTVRQGTETTNVVVGAEDDIGVKKRACQRWGQFGEKLHRTLNRKR